MTCEISRYCIPPNSTLELMARVMGWDGTALQQSDLTSIKLTVYEVDEATKELTAVANYINVTVDVATTVFDTLQVNDNWEEDSIGYNFLHVVEIETYGSPFTKRGQTYLVEFTFDPSAVGEQPIVTPVEVEVL